jgi:hypothetical protein
MNHSTRIKQIYFLLLCILLTFGCRKDTDTFTPYSESITEIKQFLSENVKSANTKTTFYFSRSISDTILTTTNNVRIWLYDTENIFADVAGNPLPCSTCDDFKVEVTEFLKKSDMLGNDITTATDNTLWESGGIIKLRITCNNQELRLRTNEYLRVQLPVASEAALMTDMKIYYGTKQTPDLPLNWLESTTFAGGSYWDFDPNKKWGYDVLSDSLGFIGTAKKITDPSAKFCVKLAPELNDKNTLVYITFPGKNMIAPTEGNFQNQEFCFENMPIGYPVKIITISKVGNRWLLGKKDTETGTNSRIEALPVEITETDLINFLSSL